ncbi:hypothetical protein ALC62_00897 [Cyphomyrmex costatus]|uniref:Uncharacterized protein n=1 Tax=Cyphomyrmex costatus TaxID=456900 RepID=A0A195D5A1_9HYME|nr:hypothetical protein ALC62_00897 [Cyphomyrmex costatus]
MMQREKNFRLMAEIMELPRRKDHHVWLKRYSGREKSEKGRKGTMSPIDGNFVKTIRKMIVLVFKVKETFVRIETAMNLGGLITPSNAKKSRTPIYLPTIEFPYLSCQGNSYEEPIMVSFVIVEPGKAHITGAGKRGLKLFRADSPGFVLDDEDDRHVNDAFPVYAPTDADTRSIGLVRVTEGQAR